MGTDNSRKVNRYTCIAQADVPGQRIYKGDTLIVEADQPVNGDLVIGSDGNVALYDESYTGRPMGVVTYAGRDVRRPEQTPADEVFVV